jgi:pyrimidine-nucleoside phosphorylase
VNILEIIEAKKLGRELSPAEIEFVVSGFIADEFPVYQMSAFLMSIWFKGMTPDEIAALTGEMLRSGEQLDTSGLSGLTADKHSTGGVGDKVSLLLAPLAAACGLKVPMLSGRGLGHTGGTLDKLESIPGYKILMENKKFLDLTEQYGCAIVGQSGNIAPADGRIYALRDVSATVDCVPLITASIMSKKLAAGPETIVIDLKTGSGAFMRDLDSAKDLATALVAVGKAYGRRMSVIFSDMDQPLGKAVGHANETIEAFDALRPGNRHTAPQDLVELTEELVADMVRVSGMKTNHEEALAHVRACWDSGAAFETMLKWVAAQEGQLDPDRPDFGLTVAPVCLELTASQAGYLEAIDCRQIGLSLADLGGARRKVEDPLDLTAGITFHPAIGDKLESGDPIATIMCNDKAKAELAANRITAALSYSPEIVKKKDMILSRIS